MFVLIINKFSYKFISNEMLKLCCVLQLQILQLECTTDQNQGGSQLESDWLTKVASMETDHEALTTEYTSSMADHRLSTANILVGFNESYVSVGWFI